MGSMMRSHCHEWHEERRGAPSGSLSSTFFYRVLRERGLIAMERLMRMLLVRVAVQMLLNGLRAFVQQP